MRSEIGDCGIKAWSESHHDKRGVATKIWQELLSKIENWVHVVEQDLEDGGSMQTGGNDGYDELEHVYTVLDQAKDQNCVEKLE